MTEKMPKRALAARVRSIRGATHVAVDSQIFELNDLGQFVWALCDGKHTIQNIGQLTLEEYDIGIDEALVDIQEFLDALQTANLISWVGEQEL